jgi:hypothetical protein
MRWSLKAMNDTPHVRIIIIEAQSEAVVGEVLRGLGGTERTRGIFVEKVEKMGDIYNVSGQAGAVGPNAKSEHDTFVQSVNSEQIPDLSVIATQLQIIRLAMKDRLASGSTAEQDDQIGQIAKAQIAAEKGDGDGVMAHLKNAGSWALDVAKEVGAEVVAKLLAKLMGA